VRANYGQAAAVHGHGRRGPRRPPGFGHAGTEFGHAGTEFVGASGRPETEVERIREGGRFGSLKSETPPVSILRKGEALLLWQVAIEKGETEKVFIDVFEKIRGFRIRVPRHAVPSGDVHVPRQRYGDREDTGGL